MKKYFPLLLILTLLTGCEFSSTRYNPDAQAVSYGCEFVLRHNKKNGQTVSAHYRCPDSTPQRFLRVNNCTWVNGYYHENGRFIEGYQRCNILRYTSSAS